MKIVFTYYCKTRLTLKLVPQILAVPEWMFLGWINQLLAFAGTEMEPMVSAVLLRIADKYPKALTLPFQFTVQRLQSQQVNSPLVNR